MLPDPESGRMGSEATGVSFVGGFAGCHAAVQSGPASADAVERLAVCRWRQVWAVARRSTEQAVASPPQQRRNGRGCCAGASSPVLRLRGLSEAVRGDRAAGDRNGSQPRRARLARPRRDDRARTTYRPRKRARIAHRGHGRCRKATRADGEQHDCAEVVPELRQLIGDAGGIDQWLGARPCAGCELG
jgi:hypothetical protein